MVLLKTVKIRKFRPANLSPFTVVQQAKWPTFTALAWHQALCITSIMESINTGPACFGLAVGCTGKAGRFGVSSRLPVALGRPSLALAVGCTGNSN